MMITNNLTNLIKKCGDQFGSLERQFLIGLKGIEGETWIASQTWDRDFSGTAVCKGKTPEEAVKKLLKELSKKE